MYKQNAILDYISVLPLCYYFFLFLSFVHTRDDRYASILVNLLIIDGLVKVVKYVTSAVPRTSWLYKNTRRPPNCLKCDYLSASTKYSASSPGFPSGHMATVVAFFLYTWSPATTEFHVLAIFSTAFARYFKNCHSFIQIIAGSIFGFIMFFCLPPIKF